jgi:pyrroloquinoline quinone biosynthesis protein E
VELVSVPADYIDGTAKPCMGGWGALSLTVAPDGTVPCPAAGALPGLDAPNVTQRRLAWIWRESKVFNAYRGQAWMRDPCRTCALRTTDFGGCRCQAYALTGEAACADPVCRHSPDHHLVHHLVDEADGPRTDLAYAYRAY